METIVKLFSFNELVGHVSYFLFALSYIMRSMFWLRILTLFGLVFEMGYFWLSGGNLLTGMGWSVIFIIINVYQLYAEIADRLRLQIPSPHEAQLRRILHGLDNAQIARLLRAGNWNSVQGGSVLIHQNQPVDALHLIVGGMANVRVNHQIVATLHPGSFAGEVAYITKSNATATVEAAETLDLLSLQPDQLKQLSAKDNVISAIVMQLLGNDLSAKLRGMNDPK